MTTRGGITIALVIGLGMTPARAQARGDHDVGNAFSLARHRMHDLAAAVRARLDESEAVTVRRWEGRRRVTDQKMVIGDVEMAHAEAQLKVQTAETGLKEYEVGTMPRQLASLEGDLASADAAQKAAEGRIESARTRLEEAKALVARVAALPQTTRADLMAEYQAARMQEFAESQIQTAGFDAHRAAFTHEQALTNKDVFVKYTKEKRLKELHAEVHKATATALRKRADLELARDVEARLEQEAKAIDADIAARQLTPAEKSALKKFAALGPSWKAVLVRRETIEKDDATTRDESRRMLDDFAKALGEAEAAWSSAREARLDDGVTATIRRVQ